MFLPTLRLNGIRWETKFRRYARWGGPTYDGLAIYFLPRKVRFLMNPRATFEWNAMVDDVIAAIKVLSDEEQQMLKYKLYARERGGIEKLYWECRPYADW